MLYEEYLNNLEKIRDRYEGNRRALLNTGHSFSLLIVRSLILINSGALFIFPAFIPNLLGKNSSLPTLPEFMVPAILFAIGLISAFLCALFSYFNYQKNAALEEYKLVHEEYYLWLRHGQDNKALPQEYVDIREQKLLEADVSINNLSPKISKFYRLGHATGWLSLIMFIVGCVFFGSIILEVQQ